LLSSQAKPVTLACKL